MCEKKSSKKEKKTQNQETLKQILEDRWADRMTTNEAISKIEALYKKPEPEDELIDFTDNLKSIGNTTTEAEQALRYIVGNLRPEKDYSLKSESLLRVVSKLEKLLPCDHIIVTGGVVLKYLGLSKARPHDLDILCIKPIPEATEILERMTLLEGNDGYPTGVYILDVDGYKVDIFIRKYAPDYIELSNGLKIHKIDDIIAEKKGANRLKDIAQLTAMAEGIITQKEVNNWFENEKKKYQ